MKLFEYYTGRMGESFERVYVWAQDVTEADFLVLQADIDMMEGTRPKVILDSKDQAFITERNDAGFGDRLPIHAKDCTTSKLEYLIENNVIVSTLWAESEINHWPSEQLWRECTVALADAYAMLLKLSQERESWRPVTWKRGTETEQTEKNGK